VPRKPATMFTHIERSSARCEISAGRGSSGLTAAPGFSCRANQYGWMITRRFGSVAPTPL
jgi:hypothetical protein